MIIVLHGALGSHHQFQDLMSTLGPQAMFIELPGHGGTPDVEEEWTIRLFSQLVEKVIEDESLHAVSIFGYSMGGYVALDLAARRPDLVRRITTLATKLKWSEQGAEREISKLDPEIIEKKVPAFAVDLAERHGDEYWRTVLLKTGQLMRTLGQQPPVTEELVSQLGLPVRYGIGDRDEMVTLEETLTFFKATPNSELFVLPGTRHPIEKVKPRLVQDLIRHMLI